MIQISVCHSEQSHFTRVETEVGSILSAYLSTKRAPQSRLVLFLEIIRCCSVCVAQFLAGSLPPPPFSRFQQLPAAKNAGLTGPQPHTVPFQVPRTAVRTCRHAALHYTVQSAIRPEWVPEAQGALRRLFSTLCHHQFADRQHISPDGILSLVTVRFYRFLVTLCCALVCRRFLRKTILMPGRLAYGAKRHEQAVGEPGIILNTWAILRSGCQLYFISQCLGLSQL